MKRQYMVPQVVVMRMVAERFIAASEEKQEIDFVEDETDVMETKPDYSFDLWEDEED